VCQKGVAEHFEQPRLALAASAAEGVNRRADPDIDETALLKHMPPACARQATGNSIGPQVDIAERSCRNLLSVRNVRKLQTPTWFQQAHDFSEDLALIGAEVGDAVAGSNRPKAVLYGRRSQTNCPTLPLCPLGVRIGSRFWGHSAMTISRLANNR
jgi:hypothetical protein